MTVKALELTWGERIHEQGAAAAKREILLDQLRTRFGELPESLESPIAQSDAAQLTRLLHQAVLVARLHDLNL